MHLLQTFHDGAESIAALGKVFEEVKRRTRRRERHGIARLRETIRRLDRRAKIRRFDERQLSRVIEFRAADGRRDALRRLADDDRRLRVQADLVAQLVKRDVLIMPAENDDRRLRQRVQTVRVGLEAMESLINVMPLSSRMRSMRCGTPAKLRATCTHAA